MQQKEFQATKITNPAAVEMCVRFVEKICKMETEAFVMPNNWEPYGDGTEMLIPERNCELALECWTLKTENIKKKNEIEKLKSEIARLKIALKRSLETVQEISPQNKELNVRLYEANSEIIALKEEIIEERSKTMLQSRVIEGHKKTFQKMKETTEKNQLEAEEVIAARNSENNVLKLTVEELKNDLFKMKRVLSEYQVELLHSLLIILDCHC